VRSSTSSLLLVGSVAIATLAGARHPAAEVLVGYVGPLTGEMALAGEQAQDGVELAVSELNAVGGVLGQKVTLDLADDYCDAEQALAAARKLVAGRVAVVIGHICSGAAIPASLLYEAARIPLVALAANPVLTGRGLRLTFRVDNRDDVNAAFTAQHMVRELAAKRIGIVHDTRVYGRGLGELVRQSLDELGTPPVLYEAVQPGQLVFADLIQRLRGAQIDMVYYAGYPREVGLLRRQMAEASFFPTLITSAASSSEEYYLISGQAVEGTLVVADQWINTAEFSQFEESFRAAYHMDPQFLAKIGYASVKIWAQAVVAAGTTDGIAVAQALHSGTFHVFGIDARFDGEGNVQGPLREPGLWLWHDRKPVPLQSSSPRAKNEP
jgi:branched-chain amino acid transport system substrate-binding protein